MELSPGFNRARRIRGWRRRRRLVWKLRNRFKFNKQKCKHFEDRLFSSLKFEEKNRKLKMFKKKCFSIIASSFTKPSRCHRGRLRFIFKSTTRLPSHWPGINAI